jgi:hypothetical protein
MSSALLYFVPAAVVLGVARFVVHPDANRPLPSALTYIENAHDDDAWLGSYSRPGSWTRAALGAVSAGPRWTYNGTAYSVPLFGHAVPRVGLVPPTVTLVSDSVTAGARHVVLRVRAPGTIDVVMRASGARILASSIDGRVVDTTRYRIRLPTWSMTYSAVPDSGTVVELVVAPGPELDFDIAARRSGLPDIRGVTIPARPSYIVPAQNGDQSVLLLHSRF